MSEFELLNLESPKSYSSDGKRSSGTSSWRNSTTQDKEVPTHLYINYENDGSPLTSNSNRNRQKLSKKSTRETSFSREQKKTTVRSQNDNQNLDSILPLSSDPDEFSTSESEYVFADQSKPKKFTHVAKTSFEVSQIQNVEARKDNKKIKISDTEFNKSSKSLRLKENNNVDYSYDKEAKKSVTSTSDSSYREKIRDRFNTLKEKAVESLSRPQSRSHSRFKLLVTKGGSRMEDLLKQEEENVLAAMERHEKIKLRWQEISRFSLEKRNKTQDDSENFFAETQIPISPIESSTAEESKSLQDSGALGTEQDTKKILASEFLGIKEDWELIEFVKARIMHTKKRESEEKHLFYPSIQSISLENKLEPGLTPRYKEEEGIYVGKKMRIPKKMKNKMECRLLKTMEGRKWFGKDGDLISATCPLKPFPTRPFFNENESSTLVQVILKPAILRNIDNRFMDISGNLNYVFDIDISSIDFSHHPLFSREHVVARRLKELYLKYKKKNEAETINRLNGRLSALRRTRDNLKSMINQSGDNADFREKLQKCENELKEVRELRYLEGQLDKQLVSKIIVTWKDLLKLREDQGYQNTSLKLNIKKKVSQDPKEEKLKWDAEIKQETEEILEELEKDYEKALKEYKEKYESWFCSRRKMEKEKEKNEDSNERLSDSESHESTNESQSYKKELIEEPDPPQPITEDVIKALVTENFQKSFRQPGEPEIEFKMIQATNTDMPLYNNKEHLRRAAVKRCMVFIKLFYNGKEVCRSKSQLLSQSFSVTIGQRFAIRILEWPESLMIEIHEETGTLNRNLLVPGIYIPFPDPFTTIYNSEIEKHEFSSKISVIYHHTAVGAGNKIIPCPDGSDFNNQAVCLYTSGTIFYRIGWVVDGGKILSPPEKYWMTKNSETTKNLLEIFKSGGPLDLSKLKKWAEYSRLDPNDPYNSAFFHFIENAEDSEETKPNHFRLNPLLEDFDFCKKNDIESNARLQLLKLRDRGESEFRDMRMVPLNEKHINREIFKNYEKRISTPHTLTDVSSSDPLDGHRVWGKKYLERVQEKLLKQYRMGKQNKQYQDIIMEESIPDVGTLGLTFMKWLRPKRPLHPVRKERKKIAPQNLSDHEINIIVNVVRAFEVPVRKDLNIPSGKENIEGFSLVNVRPFVEISFRGVTAKTTTAEGANPTWNQDLQIPIRCKNGYFSSGNLQTIKDTLYLHLFDEIVIDLIEDESARETNIHQRLERHWLASMEIPFSTLYFNSKIEGTFKLYSPPVLLGYEREAHRRNFGLGPGQEHSVSQRDATYITLFVTVQPALNPPKPIKVFQEKMESREVMKLKKHLEGWQQEAFAMFPHRKVKTLVLDITGKSVCVTRYIKPLTLPSISVKDKITQETAARFVSMIPTSGESNVLPEYFDVWLTCDQVLRLLSGNSEDHAVLLCCYFLELGFQAYVLLGSGIPRGSMAYVLVKEKGEKDGEYFVWDPTNGQKYNIRDSFCPLQKIYCLINSQNIWANVQAEELPRRTKFDLNRRTDWFPAFGKNIAPPLASVQPSFLEYRTTSRQSVEILRDKIEKKLRDNLMKWRKKSRTQWNRYCAATLRKLLPKLEESTWNLEENHSPNHIVELQPILASHKICGFPINMAYTNINAISEAVKATGVHCNEGEGVEFALAVYIHSYPYDVLSVWVYVASLVRRR